MKYFSTSILLLLFFTGLNQVQSQSVLTIDQIMQGEDFVGYLPSQVNWSDNSQLIYFSWNPDGDTIRSTYQLDMTSKEVNRLSIEGQKVRTRNGDYTKDYQWKVYEKGGDLFLVDILNDRREH